MAKSKYEYVSLSNFLYYSVLEAYVKLGFQFFFRRFKVNGLENVSKTKPVIFTVNHQSAFIDPILVGSFTPRRPWYITRAGVFNNAIARAFFNSVHMLPIYRLRDKVNIIDANEATFIRSREILKEGGSMLIFPEGNHGMRKRLRTPLKKGFARIAMEAEKESNYKLGIDIIPTGIFYEHPTKFRSDSFVNFGKPINTADYVELYKQDPNSALTKLAKDLAKEMATSLINIQPLDDYDEIEQSWHECRPKEEDLLERYNSDKDITERLKAGEQLNPKTSKQNKALNFFLKIIGLPIFIYGAINNLLAYGLTKWVLTTKIKDPHFFHSIMYACGIVITPLITLFQSFLVFYAFKNGMYAVLYFLTTPLFGVLAYDYYDVLFRGEVRPAATKLMQGYGH